MEVWGEPACARLQTLGPKPKLLAFRRLDLGSGISGRHRKKPCSGSACRYHVLNPKP